MEAWNFSSFRFATAKVCVYTFFHLYLILSFNWKEKESNYNDIIRLTEATYVVYGQILNQVLLNFLKQVGRRIQFNSWLNDNMSVTKQRTKESKERKTG